MKHCQTTECTSKLGVQGHWFSDKNQFTFRLIQNASASSSSEKKDNSSLGAFANKNKQKTKGDSFT